MTKEEKLEKYSKNREKHIKNRKAQIIAMIIVPVIGIVITLIVNFAGNSRQAEIEAAAVLDSMSVGEFAGQNANGTAIYTGTVSAVDPVSTRRKNGDYIYYHHKVEQVTKVYHKESDKYDTSTMTLSDESDTCREIAIDDVILPYAAFKNLPVYGETSNEGADNNYEKTTFSYTPYSVDGSFFLKCKDGKVSSASYYASSDVAGESRKIYNSARIIMWAAIIVIEICLVISVINTSKAIKFNGEKASGR